MKVVNITVDDEIIFKSILDADTGVLKGVSSTLKLPTGNYNNILLNFNFKNTRLCEKLNLVCSFCINGKETIDVKIGSVTVEGNAEYQTACYIPAEVFKEPCYFEFGIYGIAFDDAENVKQRISLFPVKNMVYKGSYDPNAKESEIPTPTLFEQYFAEVDVANNKLLQLEEIVNEKAMLYKKCENSYIASVGEIVIPINVENFSDMFCLIVNKNGHALIKDIDYTINYEGKTITLADAILNNETVIHFIAFSSVVGSLEEISQLIREVLGDNSITADKIEWENILNKPSMYKPPVASAEVLGGVKVGSQLKIESDGTLNLDGDYEKMANIPKINDVEVIGNKTSADLKVADAEHTHVKTEITDFPTNISEFGNDMGYATENYVKNAIAHVQIAGSGADVDLSGYADKDYVDNAVRDCATKDYVDGAIENCATKDYVDSAVSDADLTGYVKDGDLSAVAKSGSYNDLKDTPLIPSSTSQLTNDSHFIKSTLITNFWTGTQEQYDAIGSKYPSTLYLIEEATEVSE